MPSAIIPKDKEISEEIILLRRMVQMMSQQNAVDSGSRQRVTVDALAASLTLANVTNLATVASVTNIAAIAGEGVRQFEVPARNCYSNSIRNKLTFV
jgi:hypothetical protein